MQKYSRGFSLLESVLAIGILSVVLAQTVSIQANTIAATQSAINNMKSTWAQRQAAAQLEYVLDVYGAKEGIKTEQSFPWSGDPDFTIKVVPKEVFMEASRIIATAMRMGNAFSGGEEDADASGASDPAEMIKSQAAMLDSIIPKDTFKQLTISVHWKQGENERVTDSGFFLLDDRQIQNIPDMPSMPGGAGDTKTPTDPGAAGGEKTPIPQDGQ